MQPGFASTSVLYANIRLNSLCCFGLALVLCMLAQSHTVMFNGTLKYNGWLMLLFTPLLS